MTGRSRCRYTFSVTAVPACPTRSAIVSSGTPLSLMIETKELPEFAGRSLLVPGDDVVPS
jgi:hypothetical protein